MVSGNEKKAAQGILALLSELLEEPLEFDIVKAVYGETPHEEIIEKFVKGIRGKKEPGDGHGNKV